MSSGGSRSGPSAGDRGSVVASGGQLLCGFATPDGPCLVPAPCPIAVHHQADSAAMLRVAREAAARGKAPAPALTGPEFWDRTDAELDAIPIEDDPTGWQPADQPALDWGGADEFSEINSAIWSGSTTDPGRIEECLTIALGALGSLAGRGPMDPDAVHALRRMRQRAERGGPLPAYPRGPHV